jgi:hypothetical protein
MLDGVINVAEIQIDTVVIGGDGYKGNENLRAINELLYYFVHNHCYALYSTV